MAQSVPAWKRFLIVRVLPWSVVLFGLAFVYLGIEETALADVSVDWPTAEGTVIRTSINLETRSNHRAAPTSTWRPIVVYEYVVHGVRHESNRVAFGAYATARRADAEAVVAKYPTGATISISYDPDDPQQSVIEPGDGGVPWLWTALGSVFAGVGLLLVWLLPKFFVARGSVERTGARP